MPRSQSLPTTLTPDDRADCPAIGLPRMLLANEAGEAVSSADEPLWTVRELSRELHVSTKTISRWRKQGLEGRQSVFDGRARLVFSACSIQQFISDHEEQVRRGANFHRITPQERDAICRRARRLAAAGASPGETLRRVARKVGRSVETIRYTLKQYLRGHPDDSLLFGNLEPLSDTAREHLYSLFRRGESLEMLSRRFRRSPAAIQRVLEQIRARKIVDLPLDFVDNREFHEVSRDRAMQWLRDPPPASDARASCPRLPKDLPPYLASLYDVPLLDAEEEVRLFRKLNYLKYSACQLRGQLDLERPRGDLMDRIEKLHADAVEVKNRIVKANLRLVVSITKRFVGPDQDFFELISDGNMSLLRAVEKFDYGRGYKFSTYASWAILRNFARTIPTERRHRERFCARPAELIHATRDERLTLRQQESALDQHATLVGSLLPCLDDREQEIIVRRFGLIPGQPPLTLKQVGAVMGVTKERVRQIEARALSKLRVAAKDRRAEMPEAI